MSCHIISCWSSSQNLRAFYSSYSGLSFICMTLRSLANMFHINYPFFVLAFLSYHLLLRADFFSTKLKMKLLTSLTAFSSIILVAEILKFSDLLQFIFDVLDHTRSSIFNEVVHAVYSFKDASPVFWFALHC